MQKKFTNKPSKRGHVTKNAIRVPKNATFWRRLLFPSPHILLLPTFLAILFLFPIRPFSRLPFRILALLFSLYVLFTLCLRLPRFLQSIQQRFRSRFYRLERAERWAHLALLGGLLFNLFYAVFRTVMGVMTRSTWFFAESVYYMGLSAARFWLIESERKNVRLSLSQNYLQGGKILLLLSFSAIGTVTLAVGERRNAVYPDLAVWGAALFAAWRLGAALFYLLRFHRRKRSVPLFAKAISLSAAAVSLFGFQTTLLARLGTTPIKRAVWNTISGSIVCISLPVMALILLLKGKQMQKDR